MNREKSPEKPASEDLLCVGHWKFIHHISFRLTLGQHRVWTSVPDFALIVDSVAPILHLVADRGGTFALQEMYSRSGRRILAVVAHMEGACEPI